MPYGSANRFAEGSPTLTPDTVRRDPTPTLLHLPEVWTTTALARNRLQPAYAAITRYLHLEQLAADLMDTASGWITAARYLHNTEPGMDAAQLTGGVTVDAICGPAGGPREVGQVSKPAAEYIYKKDETVVEEHLSFGRST